MLTKIIIILFRIFEIPTPDLATASVSDAAVLIKQDPFFGIAVIGRLDVYFWSLVPKTFDSTIAVKLTEGIGEITKSLDTNS